MLKSCRKTLRELQTLTETLSQLNALYGQQQDKVIATNEYFENIYAQLEILPAQIAGD